MPQKVLLLVNTGTPDGPDERSVKRYLSEFLNDPFVIDIPWISRKILVNLIIVPFRTRKSARLYSRLWTREGSPLKVNLEKLTKKVQLRLNGEYIVAFAMRYGSPSISSALAKVPENHEITVFPLFPQYASATTGSVVETVTREAKSLKSCNLKFIGQFWSHPAFIHAFAEKIKGYDPAGFDHIVFSYHSLPVRQIRKIHKEVDPENCNCDREFPRHGSLCYKASCYATTRLLARKLDLPGNLLTTAFQSRMSESWIGPFTGSVIRDLALTGKKRILVVSPSFVSDCLETLVEIREEYGKIFLSAGGHELVLAEGLNHDDAWADTIAEIVKKPV